ncbi:uncharacterized protein LOC135948838 [Calliphora vicina]|uniref:uncharacterized protein LOC135948838 n=2 Tax=Calliphora vicina TaxID=7373 RepID=UPI00325B9F9B
MEIEDVENLFKKLDKQYTGELIKFKAGLREWRRNINLPFICEKETLSANSRILDWLEKISEKLSNSGYSDCPLSTQTSGDNSICGTSLTNLLRNTVKGQLVLTFNEKNNYLDSKNQKTLVHCIIEKYIGTRSKLTYAEMQQWSYAICDVFPKEKPETYFLKRKDGKKNPTGKLFSRWTNVEKGKFDDYSGSTVEETFKDFDSDKYFEQKCWLQHNCSPRDQVLSFWRETRKIRMDEIKNASSLTNIFKEWPRYNDFLGYDLVDIDFDFLCPDKVNKLFLKLETFYKKLVKVFDNEIKDRASRELYLQYLRNENINKDCKYCICTILLHALLQPQRLNKEHKPSIADAQTDFVTLVPTLNDIEPRILQIVEMYAERKERLQPRVMVVGPDFSKISDFFVFCDGLKWKCPSYMKCIDIIIKLSYVFNTEYSPKSKQVWSFLEQYFFDLKSEDFSSVANLLSILQ